MATMPPQDSIEAQLMAYIAEHESELIEFCRKLLQTPSVNSVDDELAIAKVITHYAHSMGLVTEIAGLSAQRPNAIVHTEEQGDTGLLLIGHLDTVAPGDAQAWTYPPFSAAIANGKLYGRGAVDTKAGMASAIIALAALKVVPDSLHKGRA